MIRVIFSRRQNQAKPVLVCGQCDREIFDHDKALVGWQTEGGQIVDGRVFCIHIDCRPGFEAKARGLDQNRDWSWLTVREFLWLMSDGLGLLNLKKVSGRRNRRRK